MLYNSLDYIVTLALQENEVWLTLLVIVVESVEVATADVITALVDQHLRNTLWDTVRQPSEWLDFERCTDDQQKVNIR